MKKEWTVREVANEANTSLGYTHAVLTSLMDMQYLMRRENNKLRLMNADLLLKRWAAFNQYVFVNKFLQYYTFEREIDHFIKSLGQKLQNQEYALTSFAGAWLVSPYVRPADVHFYIRTPVEAEKIAELLEIKPAAGTGNIKMVLPYDEGVFYGAQTVEGITVVSNVQLIVDLWNFSSRGEDAAKGIYELLEKDWSNIAGNLNV
jgi:hypothetical protein